MPLHVVDTAGLCDTDDQVEKIGVERALKAIFLGVTFVGLATMWMAVFADMGVALLVV